MSYIDIGPNFLTPDAHANVLEGALIELFFEDQQSKVSAYIHDNELTRDVNNTIAVLVDTRDALIPETLMGDVYIYHNQFHSAEYVKLPASSGITIHETEPPTLNPSTVKTPGHHGLSSDDKAGIGVGVPLGVGLLGWGAAVTACSVHYKNRDDIPQVLKVLTFPFCATLVTWKMGGYSVL